MPLTRKEEQFMDELFNHHSYDLLRLGNFLVGYNKQYYGCVEDCVQETFLAAFQSISKLQSHPNVAGWLRHVLENRIRKRMKKERILTAATVPIEDIDAIMDTSQDDEVEQFPLDESNRQTVKKALEQLSDTERKLITSYYFEERSVREMAVECQTSQNVINVQLHRIRQKLKRILQDFIFLLMLLLLSGL